MKRISKVLALHTVGITGILLFYHLSTSEGIHNFLGQAERARTDRSLGVFTIAVLVKYLLPIGSVAIILFTTFFLLKRKED